ncbi:hypothetical protein CDD80_3841 [Ophiocordyceps camponoti-rufipedis]|uniref:Elongation factor 2 n=1 Tax=Ophiocordyceps camponoti-rufipedis TaxID=2004952 RepID=A0A2C5Z174_9HYPO|nr:hypothetical protein CDD80_3841 [Ophiocordyceps camponoti-rufipedis]
MSLVDDVIVARSPERPEYRAVLPVLYIIAALLVIFFLLYFNRVFASIVSYGIRAFTWNQYRIFIDFKALQISLLAGRIFFTGLRYHGSNETLLVQHGTITWRYWLRRVRDVDVQASSCSGEDAGSKQARNAALPCRINVNVVGVEIFIYNRSPAYDTILSGIVGSGSSGGASTGVFVGQDEGTVRPRKSDSNQEDKDDSGAKTEKSRDSTSARSGSDAPHRGPIGGKREEAQLPFILQLLPIHVDCQKAAIVIGNDTTKAILTAKANSAAIDIDASPTHTCDPYRQIAKVTVERPKIETRDNEGFKEDQIARATRRQEDERQAEPPLHKAFLRRTRRRLLDPLRKIVPWWRRSVEPFSAESKSAGATRAAQVPGAAQWQGLSRYLDEQDQDDKARWTSVEYGAVPTIVDSPQVTITLFWDVPGRVTEQAHLNGATSSPPDVNGSEPPAWGMSLSVKGGTVNYGPWTDRQRFALQSMFFPTISKDATPATPLPVGAWRVPTQFTLFIEIEEAATLRIITREESKNWRWRGKEPATLHKKGPSKRMQWNRAKKNSKGDASHPRPAGWMEIKLPTNSTVSFTTDMLASTSGYKTNVNIDLPSAELSTSVNHDLLYRCGAQRITCNMPMPLSWNSLRIWHVTVDSDDLDLFLLRDHVFLLADLIADWGAGAMPEYLQFVPFEYYLHLNFRNARLIINVNEQNIIDKATAPDDNTYMMLSSPRVNVTVHIPIDKFQPDKTAVSFDVRADTPNLVVNVPQSSTQAAILPCTDLGVADGLVVSGSFNFNSTVAPGLTDTIVLKVHVQAPHVRIYGFIMRYIVLLRDNIFAEYMHFKTLGEYLELKKQGADTVTPPSNTGMNELDLILAVRVDDPRALIAANVYCGGERCIQADLADLSLDLRLNSYIMDMEVSLSPVSLSLGRPMEDAESVSASSSDTQVFADGLRIFCHRTFGLPGNEQAYLTNWDVGLGAISGECTAEFLATLVGLGLSFLFTFDDAENALIPYSMLVFPDLVFARIAVDSFHVWVHIDEAAFLVSTDKIELISNDWARSHYSKRTNIVIPNLQLCCVNAEAATARHTSRRHHAANTEAYLQTDIQIAMVGRKFHFSAERKSQQDLIRREDQRTERTQFLLLGDPDPDFVPDTFEPPAQPSPMPPVPITEADVSLRSPGGSSHFDRNRGPGRQSSSLSLSSSYESRLNGESRTKLKDKRGVFGSTGRRTASGRRLDAAYEWRRSTSRDPAGLFPFKDNLDHMSVAFSSQYFAPHFPLESVRADTREAEYPEVPDESYDDGFWQTEASLDEIDPSSLSEEHSHESTIIEFPSGISAFFRPEALRHAISLLAELQPKDPESILDFLQVGAINEVFAAQKPEYDQGTIQEISVRIPSAEIRVLNDATAHSYDDSCEEQDQYDVRLTKLALVSRTVTEKGEAEKMVTSANPRTSLHFRLKSAEVCVSERSAPPSNPQEALMLEIDTVILSLGTKDVTYFDADVGSVVGSTASGKIDYIVSLIHRTSSLATDLERIITDTTASYGNRARYLAYHLLSEGSSTKDPSFFTRPSAVLRSAPTHLRRTDTWKLIMRLRQIWATMGNRRRSQLAAACHDGSLAVPPDALNTITAAFERWRSWDLEDTANSVLVKHLFDGEKDGADVKAGRDFPLIGACRLGELRFVLDPGPRQNNVAFIDVAVRVEQKPADSSDTVPEMAGFNGPLTVCNISCSEAEIHLNWGLCELAEDLLRLYNQSLASTLGNFESHDAEVSKSPLPAFHIAFELSRGSIDLETINLSLKTLSCGLKGSILVYSIGDKTDFASCLLNCNTITSRLHSGSQLLSVFQLRQPSVFVSHELQETQDASLRTIKSTASSQGLKLAVKQDPIALLEVIGLLVKDEAAQLSRLHAQFTSSPPPPKPVKISDRLSKVRINVALFLESYTISVSLLQSLTWKISGVVARMACAANNGKEVIFDFDVKENSHEMQIKMGDEPRSISLLQIPPMNGRIRGHAGEQSGHSLSVLSSIEVIRLDASAIYSLLAVLNRPQISNAVDDMQQQIKVVQEHIEDVFGGSRPPPPIEPAPPRPLLAYDVHVTLAGLRILAKTSLTSKSEPMAQIYFSLDKTSLLACNQRDPQEPALKYPDLHLNLLHVGLDIRRGSKDASRCCGSIGTSATVSASSRRGDDGREDWNLNFRSNVLDVNLSPETVSTVIDVVGYLGTKIKDLDTSRELEYLRKLRQPKSRAAADDQEKPGDEADIIDSVLASVVCQFELRNIRVCWNVADKSTEKDSGKEDMVLSVELIEFGTRTRKSARLTISSILVQSVPPGHDKSVRSLHSALLPSVIFNAAYTSTAGTRRMAFQATGESLDLRLTSGFIVPAASLVKSISLSFRNVQKASAQWTTDSTVAPKKAGESSPESEQQQQHWSFLDNKRLESLLVDADFAGAVVYVSSKNAAGSSQSADQSWRPALDGKYGQFKTDDLGSAVVLRSPGVAGKAEYRDSGGDDPTLYGEVKIDASSNTLHPSVVPLVMDIVSSVKEVVSDDGSQDKGDEEDEPPKLKPERSADEDNILTADPSAVLGRVKLNLGLRICRQAFTLSCQPVGRVEATACFDNVYFTVNTVHSLEQGNFFAISGTLSQPQASVQHVYSRQSTASFGVDTVTVSFMNSKHVSGTNGVSVILKVSPMKASINAKQAQDFLLFREIWHPDNPRHAAARGPVAKLETETSQGYLVQRYQQVAATAAFPWTATISIAALDVHVDLGQAIGKSVFQISDFWVSSKKTSDWEQNLCLGFQRIGIDCTGRLSGFIALQSFRLRTSIQWPKREEALNKTPLIHASLAFNACRAKAAFDYQAFLVADITSLDFLMYNVREKRDGSGDRLVAMLDGEAVQVFGTTASAAQGLRLFQAIQKLVQEKKESFESSLREIDKFTRRKAARTSDQPAASSSDVVAAKSPISLDTHVVVTFKALNLGVFPATFSDHQVFKVEALNAHARFSASLVQRRIHSVLRMTLGQLRIGLAGMRNVEAPKPLSEVTVEDVVARVTGSRGGTILNVPRVEAMMETWQRPDSNLISYIFKSALEGKVEVGWNYSRISYIRGMWAKHTKALEQIWGRQLPMTAVKITGVPEAEAEAEVEASAAQGEPEVGSKDKDGAAGPREGGQQKITAEVKVPQSKYEYEALEPPIIDTPQLRDMGEATPPLEWIGLHRDKLPNLTHQMVIVSLLELAGEVEDAYSRILGSS